MFNRDVLQVFNSDAGASAKAEVFVTQYRFSKSSPCFFLFGQALREACASHTEMIKVASAGAWYDRHMYVHASVFMANHFYC